MPTAPYVLVSFDVDYANPDAGRIMADVLAGFPDDVRPVSMGVEHLYVVEVPSSQAFPRFTEVGMYLTAQDANHGGVLRWVVQLCRIDEIATG
jgi:hypothetical protein